MRGVWDWIRAIAMLVAPALLAGFFPQFLILVIIVYIVLLWMGVKWIRNRTKKKPPADGGGVTSNQ